MYTDYIVNVLFIFCRYEMKLFVVMVSLFHVVKSQGIYIYIYTYSVNIHILHYKIGICYFSAKHAVLWRKSKYWLA
jgi:hypothetical protein